MDQVSLRYGGRDGQQHSFQTRDDLVVIRTLSRSPIASTRLAGPSLEVLHDTTRVLRFQPQGVEVVRVAGRSARDEARRVLGADPAIEFAGRVLSPPGTDRPVVYTENLFVRFRDGVPVGTAEKLLRARKLAIKRRVGYLPRAYFVGAPEGTGLAVFDLASELLERDEVELCHPELAWERAHKKAGPQQWHLQKSKIGGTTIDAHASVVAAWPKATGSKITIAIIDTGIDVDHEEFSGAAKVVAPRDATDGDDDPRPVGRDEDHGTACAGVACGNGHRGASGVAPRARLMPIRLQSPLGAQNEADSFAWAADHGADVISCSWGPADGLWYRPSDPAHHQIVPIPDSTRLAIDYATTKGRKGRGCVLFFAAGNGNESVDNDGYASYSKVIAVAACNDRGTRSVYSDFGKAVWCSFPSNDFGFPNFSHPDPLTSGIWTTDRSGKAGYNHGGGTQDGDQAGNYTNSFGGTSSASPGAAGVAALVLSANPALDRIAVKDILKRCCDRIDAANGGYDSTGHSEWYGYGRLNAARAVELARAARQLRPVPRPASKTKKKKAKTKPTRRGATTAKR